MGPDTFSRLGPLLAGGAAIGIAENRVISTTVFCRIAVVNFR